MRKLFSIFSFVLLFSTFAFGQAAVDLQLSASDGSAVIPLAVGLDLTATNGIDPALGESDLPPFPPAGVFECRFDLTLYAGSALSTYNDYRNAPAFPFTGIVEHQLWYQTSAGGLPIDINYDLPPGAVMTIDGLAPGFGLPIGPFTGTGVATIPGSYTVIFNKAFVIMDYTNIGPPATEPIFATDVPSLDFGPVGVGIPSGPLTVQVQNTGTAALDIASVIPSDVQYTVAPNPPATYPISIPIGGTYDFDVEFTPAGLGPQPATIDFTHNATSSPDLFPVTGVGADAGPTFGVSPTSLAFGVVEVGLSPMQQLTVTNNGLTNTLNISSITLPFPEYTITPPTAAIPPGGNQIFDVTFTPTLDVVYDGDITFNHDGSTSPDVVPVTGEGYIAPTLNGLVFEQDTAFVLEDDFYSETMQLTVPPGPDVQAMQFRLVTNMAIDDTTILTFTNIQKGSDVADPSWVLEYNVRRGTINSNGASIDTILVLLYNLQQNNGLAAGTVFTDLLTVNYKVANLPALQDYAKSSFLIRFPEASSFEGAPITIETTTPLRDELVVIAKNRVGSWGDVNGDGCLDILDLIMVVDHIVGRDSLDADEFARADIAPWSYAPGSEPTPDGFVNVQDLTIIQNTILTGFFPNGDPVGLCGGTFTKFNGEADAIVNLYINSEGITAYLDSKVGIRGAQIQFGNLVDNAENMVINTDLGQGFYLKVDDVLRTLMYDRLAEKYVEAGTFQFMADMPFTITNPEDISLDKLILVDTDQGKVMKLEVNIIYSTTILPYDYILFQNYPNPFNPNTSVRFQVPKSGNVTVKIYDMLGQEVRTLFADAIPRGTYTVNWDGLSDAGVQMSSGSYIYRMIAGEFVQSKKMILLK